MMRRPDAGIDLVAGALLIAAAAEPGLDPRPSLRQLEGFAEGIKDLVGLCRRLFVELGFEGDSRNYYSPRNSLLHRVIERRRGIPITLSIVTLEVGRRAGMRLQPIGMPGHFLVRDPQTGLYIDSFGAAVLDRRECEALFRVASGAGPELVFSEEHTPVVGPREILARLLGNLAHVYRRNADGASLERVLRMRLAIPGVPAQEVLDLAQAMASQGRVREAAAELETRAGKNPAEAVSFRAAARGLRARLN